MRKSQISIEILFSIGFSIFVFIVLLGFTMDKRQEVSETETTLEEKAECHKISNLISGVYSAGPGTGLIETLVLDASIDADNSITVGSYTCKPSISPYSIEFNHDHPEKLCKGDIVLNNTIEGNMMIVKVKNFETC